MILLRTSLLDRTVSSGGAAGGRTAKREVLARWLSRCGLAALARSLPARDALVVLTYHRVGHAANDAFDPALFSATPEEFDRQLACLRKGGARLVTLEEAIAFAAGEGGGASTLSSSPGFRVLLTFDDGYRDNYDAALPILRSHNAPAVFFLTTSFVGTAAIPWWDRLAYTLRTARERRFAIRFPASYEVDLDAGGFDHALARLVAIAKGPAAQRDLTRFLDGVEENARGEGVPRSTERRFVSWENVREMAALPGMAIGAHTVTHAMLSSLTAPGQRRELEEPRAVLREKLGLDAAALAYPFGRPASYSEETEALARQAGYRVAFSFGGGVNPRRPEARFELERVAVSGQSLARLQAQLAMARVAGRFWP